MPIELTNVSYTYLKGTPLARLGLRDVDLHIGDGEWIAVMGPTGSGKSTLLQHLNGLLKPDAGTVLIDNFDIHSSAKILRETRQKVGLVFQYPEHQLFSSTVWKEICYGPENFGFSSSDVETAVKKAMDIVGLEFTRYKDCSPTELSGGEKRRVALAGILAANPRFIVLDEPTAGMDYSGKQRIVEAVRQLNRDRGVTVVWVTHDITEVADLADRLLVLNSGRVEAVGATREILADLRLAALGLDVPIAVTVADCLRKKGKPLAGYPVTIDEIKQEIVNLLR